MEVDSKTSKICIAHDVNIFQEHHSRHLKTNSFFYIASIVFHAKNLFYLIQRDHAIIFYALSVSLQDCTTTTRRNLSFLFMTQWFIFVCCVLSERATGRLVMMMRKKERKIRRESMSQSNETCAVFFDHGTCCLSLTV